MNCRGSQFGHSWTLAIATLALLLGLFLSSCTARFVAPYDAKLDAGITSFHEALETYTDAALAELARSPTAAPFEQFRSYFDSQTVSLQLLLARSQATPKNDLTTRQVVNLQQQLANARTLHEMHERWRTAGTSPAPTTQDAGAAPLTPAVLMLARDSMRASVRAMLTLELAKRRESAQQY